MPVKPLTAINFPIKKGKNPINAVIIALIKKSYFNEKEKVTKAAEK